MLGVLANHHNTAFAANNLALLAHGLHGRSYLHKFVTFLSAFCVLDFAGRGLFAAPGDPATGQVIGRHLHGDLIAGQDPDEIHSEFSGDVCQNHVAISNVHLESRVGQGLYHNAFHFDHVGFCQTLSLLVRLDFPAVGRECPAKLTVGDLLAAFDLIRQTAVILRHKQHVFAFFAFR